MNGNNIREFFEQVDLYKTASCVAVFNRIARESPVLFRLIYCCGLRNNEACSLKICDVDPENGLITLYRTKGNKDWIVYLADDERDMCVDHLKWLSSELGNDCELL